MTITRILVVGSLAMALFALSGCYFSEFAQEADLEANIDQVRTGCEIDTDGLMAAYKQYDANRYHRGDGPTPVPDPIDDTELTTMILLEMVWANGCETGRRDAAGAEQASLMALRDQFDLLQGRLELLEESSNETLTPTPSPTASPTPDSN